MTTAVAEPGAVEQGHAHPGGGATLDELITAAWEDLAVRGHAACPVCGERMGPTVAAAGRCGGCGSELD
jgi:hypothetical protein